MSTSPLPLQGAAQQIVSSPAPVLLLDTCSVLDILRAPYRKDVPTRVIPAAQHVLYLGTTTPKRLWLVTSEQVPREFARHESQEKSRCSNVITEADKLQERLVSALKQLGLMNFASIPKLAPNGLESNLSVLGNDLLSNALAIGLDNLCVQLATHRVVLRRAPGEKGGSVEDCLIFEHYLALVRMLRNQGFQERCIFITSNKNDYGDPGNPKPDISADLLSVSLEYAPNFAKAEQALGLIPSAMR